MKAVYAAANVTCFCASRLDYAIIGVLWKVLGGKSILGKVPLQSHQRSAQATLVVLVEFKRYLERLEKDLSHMSKKYSNREVAQGVGFVAAGIHEALNYLEIVKKVIVKTERAIAKKNVISESSALSTNPLE